jgi:hypothetical protein
MDLFDDRTRRGLERLINDDLKHAEIMSACVSIQEDRRIVVDEITFRLEDGRLMSVDVGDVSYDVGHVTAHSKALVLETYVEQDAKRLGVKEGWRESDILLDYRQELADAIAEGGRV